MRTSGDDVSNPPGGRSVVGPGRGRGGGRRGSGGGRPSMRVGGRAVVGFAGGGDDRLATSDGAGSDSPASRPGGACPGSRGEGRWDAFRRARRAETRSRTFTENRGFARVFRRRAFFRSRACHRFRARAGGLRASRLRGRRRSRLRRRERLRLSSATPPLFRRRLFRLGRRFGTRAGRLGAARGFELAFHARLLRRHLSEERGSTRGVLRLGFRFRSDAGGGFRVSALGLRLLSRPRRRRRRTSRRFGVRTFGEGSKARRGGFGVDARRRFLAVVP